MPRSSTICRPVFRSSKPIRCAVPGKKTLSASRSREARARGARVARAHQHRGRAAVAEDRARDHVGRRAVPALEGQARELEREQQRGAVRVGGQVVGGARQADDAARAARLRDRQPREARAEAERLGDVGVHRRDHEAGAGDAHHQADLGRREAGGGERAAAPRRRRRGRRSRGTAVLGLEVARVEDLLDRHDARARRDTRGLVDREQPLAARAALRVGAGLGRRRAATRGPTAVTSRWG